MKKIISFLMLSLSIIILGCTPPGPGEEVLPEEPTVVPTPIILEESTDMLDLKLDNAVKELELVE